MLLQSDSPTLAPAVLWGVNQPGGKNSDTKATYQIHEGILRPELCRHRLVGFSRAAQRGCGSNQSLGKSIAR